MAISMYVGIKKPNGSVSAMCARVDGGEDQNKLFYKYYRTPERVNALIKSGSTRSALGIYISKSEETDERNPLYNEEVTMLPLYIGSDGIKSSKSSFAESKFYEEKIDNSGIYYDYDNVEDFYVDAEQSGFFEHYVYLFDSESCEWIVGYKGKPLKEVIIENYDENSIYNYNSSKEQLISNIDKIDQFIAERKNKRPCFVDSNTGEVSNIHNGELLRKYNDLRMYAMSIGLIIEGCMVSQVEEKPLQYEKKRA